MKLARVSHPRMLFMILTVLLCTSLLISCAAPAKVVNIIDITTMDARDYQFYAGEELIDEDSEWLYYLDLTRAHGCYVEYADGSTRSIHDALAAGDITREELNTYGILHTAYSKQYADEPVLKWAPMLTVICGDARTDAYRGTCVWNGGCIDALSPAAAKKQGIINPLILDKNAPGQAVLLFEIAPDAISVRYNGRKLEVTETSAVLDDGCLVKAFSIDLQEGSALYEIHADWSSGWDVKDSTWYYTRRNSGDADYGFCIEAAG